MMTHYYYFFFGNEQGNKCEVSDEANLKFLAFINCKDLWQIAPLQQYLTMEPVNNVL